MVFRPATDRDHGPLVGFASVAVLAGALVASLSAPAFAQVAPVVSRSWAGYVAGGRGDLKFQDVSALWRQPGATCTPNNPGFSGIWVGLGGFKPTSKAVEQIGTELDCGASGRITSEAWFELAPGPAHRLTLPVFPGDLIRASVHVDDGQARLRLADVSRHESFDKRLAVHAPDVSSAEWIVEAPTGCAGQGDCGQLPLADFGTARIADAHASTRGGLTGSTVSNSWITTKVLMLPDPIPYDPSGTGYAAIPSPQHADGSAFTVRWLSSGFAYLGRVAGSSPQLRLQPGGVLRPSHVSGDRRGPVSCAPWGRPTAPRSPGSARPRSSSPESCRPRSGARAQRASPQSDWRATWTRFAGTPTRSRTTT